MPLSLVTGASRGLGLALTEVLVAAGHHVIVDARQPHALASAVSHLGDAVTVVAGDVTDPAHRTDLAAAVTAWGGALDLLVHNAGGLGPTPLPRLVDVPGGALHALLDVNVVAPIALTAAVLPALTRAGGTVVTVSSDAAVQRYEGWGAYGLTKAALDHVAGTLAVEHPALTVHAFDPGDLRTSMHQAAFPGEDISDRPLPETVAPAILALLDGDRPSGRWRASALLALEVGA